jgi:catalase (peroxidase I)
MEFGDVSLADLIMLAGNSALESENSELKLKFCGGGVDADGPFVSKKLDPRIYSDPLVTVLDDFLVKGLSNEEGVALASRQQVGSKYYEDLLVAGEGSGDHEFTEYELALLKSKDLQDIVKKFSKDEKKLLETFIAAWTKMMTADRFLNNRENACAGVDTKTK